ncbi:MAG TPA: DUF5309 family protein [Thermoanaerobaculia bacterium]|nr:DUF5309 family protein [Thermoanaerobaculia bacterium]
MSGITGLGTTYNLPNYTGELISITPSETPLLTAIGGLTGGRQTTSTEFEWQTSDGRNAGQNVALEGATAPTATARVRGNVTNVVQVQQSKVATSYTKLAAVGLKAGSNNDLMNPVTNELDWQVRQELIAMARDIEYSFINGSYQKPSDNTTARKTRGLLAAITTNLQAKATATSAALSAATDTVTEASTPVSNADKIIFTDVGASTTLQVGRIYHVRDKASGSFKVAASAGGAAVTIGTATVQYRLPWTTTLTTSHVDDILQQVWDGGGLKDMAVATLIVNSVQKRAITAAYAGAYGKFNETSRTVGGVAVETIVTDFGIVNVMLNRFMPQDAICVASLEELAPVFLEVPGKGHFFAEPLAKTGASDDVQLYGEVGLAYGAESHHGLVTGLDI